MKAHRRSRPGTPRTRSRFGASHPSQSELYGRTTTSSEPTDPVDRLDTYSPDDGRRTLARLWALIAVMAVVVAGAALVRATAGSGSPPSGSPRTVVSPAIGPSRDAGRARSAASATAAEHHVALKELSHAVELLSGGAGILTSSTQELVVPVRHGKGAVYVDIRQDGQRHPYRRQGAGCEQSVRTTKTRSTP